VSFNPVPLYLLSQAAAADAADAADEDVAAEAFSTADDAVS
jgi:hypothetical protein